MKRLIAVLLGLLLLLCGCAEEPQETTEPHMTVVGISQVGAESDWRVANSESMKAAFSEEKGYRLLFSDARQKQENQIMAVRKFIQQQVDYIVLMPLCETGWDSVLQEAKEAGIPVILVDRMADVEDDSLYAAHVGSDFYGEGLSAVKWMESRYARRADPVEIIHIQGTMGSTAQIGRTRALEEAVSRHQHWQVLACLDGDFTQAKAYEVLGDYLDTLPNGQDFDVVYCENDNEAFGAIEALREHGYRVGTDVDVICFDATANALRLCGAGEISLVVECNPLLGPLAEEIVRTMEEGKIPPKHKYIDERMYVQANITEELIAGREY